MFNLFNLILLFTLLLRPRLIALLLEFTLPLLLMCILSAIDLLITFIKILPTFIPDITPYIFSDISDLPPIFQSLYDRIFGGEIMTVPQFGAAGDFLGYGKVETKRDMRGRPIPLPPKDPTGLGRKREIVDPLGSSEGSGIWWWLAVGGGALIGLGGLGVWALGAW